MKFSHSSFQIAGLIALVVTWSIVGCAPQSSSKPAENAATDEKPADSATAEEEKPPAGQTEPEPVDEPVSNKVQLPSDELFAGIPGSDGPLKIEEIKTWLDKPENHEVLEIELPLGLNTGKIPDGVLENNPLTRAKIELGRQLFFDGRLSADGSIKCSSCHMPAEGFTRRTRFAVGIKNQEGPRNAPVMYNRILSTLQFWDGRAASIEDQAKGPPANPIEMGNTLEKVVEAVKGVEGYRLQFAKVFGKDEITIDDVVAAIAAFERMVVTGPSPFDYYEQLKSFDRFDKQDLEEDAELKAMYDKAVAEAKAHPMSESAVRGRDLYFSERINCAACHVGANLADEKYHNIGVGMNKKEPDVGRFKVTKKEEDIGAYKTPTVRNCEFSAPYMHDGSLATLMDVVEHYDKGGIPNDHLSSKMKKLNMTKQEKEDLVAFMIACSGRFPVINEGRLPQ